MNAAYESTKLTTKRSSFIVAKQLTPLDICFELYICVFHYITFSTCIYLTISNAIKWKLSSCDYMQALESIIFHIETGE